MKIKSNLNLALPVPFATQNVLIFPIKEKRNTKEKNVVCLLRTE